MEEVEAGASMAIDFGATKDDELTIKSNGAFRKSFKFDAVFGPKADQGNNNGLQGEISIEFLNKVAP